MDQNFQASIHKSSKQFGYSFAFDALTLWNALMTFAQLSLFERFKEGLKDACEKGISSMFSINVICGFLWGVTLAMSLDMNIMSSFVCCPLEATLG